MTAHHCPGCTGYTRSLGEHCPGIATGSALADDEIRLVDAVPPLRFADRLKALIGLPVILGVREGPLGEPFGTIGADPEETSQYWDGPWKDIA